MKSEMEVIINKDFSKEISELVNNRISPKNLALELIKIAEKYVPQILDRSFGDDLIGYAFICYILGFFAGINKEKEKK